MKKTLKTLPFLIPPPADTAILTSVVCNYLMKFIDIDNCAETDNYHHQQCFVFSFMRVCKARKMFVQTRKRTATASRCGCRHLVLISCAKVCKLCSIGQCVNTCLSRMPQSYLCFQGDNQCHRGHSSGSTSCTNLFQNAHCCPWQGL